MGFERNIARAVFSAAVLVLAASAAAAPREPLVVTKLADPDPNYIPLAESKHAKADAAQADANSRIEDAMQTFGRAIGQAAMVEQQQIEARCSAGAPSNATREQLFAYEAACRYSRH